jgi:hypothetical protein
MISQQLCFIAVDTITNKIVSVICGEDLFEELNPDYPLHKPMFTKLKETIFNKNLDKFIREGLIEKRKANMFTLEK